MPARASRPIADLHLPLRPGSDCRGLPASWRRVTSLAEIGRVSRAGTNCGSCVPELKKVLREREIG